MSRASELADQLEALDKASFTSMWAREGDKAVVAELRRLDRVNAELVEASMEARRLNALGLDCEDVLSAALTSATKEQQK